MSASFIPYDGHQTLIKLFFFFEANKLKKERAKREGPNHAAEQWAAKQWAGLSMQGEGSAVLCL